MFVCVCNVCHLLLLFSSPPPYYSLNPPPPPYRIPHMKKKDMPFHSQSTHTFMVVLTHTYTHTNPSAHSHPCYTHTSLSLSLSLSPPPPPPPPPPPALPSPPHDLRKSSSPQLTGARPWLPSKPACENAHSIIFFSVIALQKENVKSISNTALEHPN